MIAADVPLWTTTLILIECGNRVARRADFRALVAEFHEEMETGGHLVRPDVHDERAAWAAYRRGEAGLPAGRGAGTLVLG